MIVTGALLAESASAVDNKLEVRGGVVDKYRAEPHRVATVTLVVLIQPQPFDKAPVISVTITPPSGAPHHVDFDVPEPSLGGAVGFVCAPLRFPVPVDGTYRLSVGRQSTAITLPLTVYR